MKHCLGIVLLRSLEMMLAGNAKRLVIWLRTVQFLTSAGKSSRENSVCSFKTQLRQEITRTQRMEGKACHLLVTGALPSLGKFNFHRYGSSK